MGWSDDDVEAMLDGLTLEEAIEELDRMGIMGDEQERFLFDDVEDDFDDDDDEDEDE